MVVEFWGQLAHPVTILGINTRISSSSQSISARRRVSRSGLAAAFFMNRFSCLIRSGQPFEGHRRINVRTFLINRLVVAAALSAALLFVSAHAWAQSAQSGGSPD